MADYALAIGLIRDAGTGMPEVFEVLGTLHHYIDREPTTADGPVRRDGTVMVIQHTE